MVGIDFHNVVNIEFQDWHKNHGQFGIYYSLHVNITQLEHGEEIKNQIILFSRDSGSFSFDVDEEDIFNLYTSMDNLDLEFRDHREKEN